MHFNKNKYHNSLSNVIRSSQKLNPKISVSPYIYST